MLRFMLILSMSKAQTLYRDVINLLSQQFLIDYYVLIMLHMVLQEDCGVFKTAKDGGGARNK